MTKKRITFCLPPRGNLPPLDSSAKEKRKAPESFFNPLVGSKGLTLTSPLLESKKRISGKFPHVGGHRNNLPLVALEA